MAEHWNRLLTRWMGAGLIDDDTAARIRAFEEANVGPARWRWPVWLALAFGVVMLGAGVLLFVSAHWDALSPAARFALVIGLVAVFHVAGAVTAGRFDALAIAFHAIGTVAFGAGIFLAGQIFNLNEHWPGGVMLWTIGAAIAWGLLRAWPELALLAILAPIWLVSEWIVATQGRSVNPGVVASAGVFLLALAYLAGVGRDRTGHSRRTLVWVGGLMLLPAASALASSLSYDFASPARSGLRPFPASTLAAGWAIAFGTPLAVAAILRRAGAWPVAVAAVWVAVLVGLRPAMGWLPLYPWWAIGAAALVAWGVGDGRRERINLGSSIFAATVLIFYFSQVMGKLERSASLIGLGLVFLAGGWLLERTRRQLLRRAKGHVA